MQQSVGQWMSEGMDYLPFPEFLFLFSWAWNMVMVLNWFYGCGGEDGGATNCKTLGFLNDVMELSCPASFRWLTLFGGIFVMQWSVIPRLTQVPLVCANILL